MSGRLKLIACTSQTAVVASKLAVARQRPSGDQATQRMVRVCASSRIAAQLHASLPGCWRAHIRTVLSPLQLANMSPAKKHTAPRNSMLADELPMLPASKHNLTPCGAVDLLLSQSVHSVSSKWMRCAFEE